MNLAERQQRVRDLEAMVARSKTAHESQRARYEAAQAALNLVLSIYIDTITAPLRAFAAELREGNK